LYREIADIIIDTGDQSVGSIVQHLEETLNKHANAHR
jgi:hypothetical protein